MAPTSADPSGAREWAGRMIQWNPARATVKRVVHAGAGVRGRWLEQRGQVPAIAHLYAAGSPKAGSQWMKALFDHPVVRAHTGLFTLPQLDYQQNPARGFPPGTFVPGLYLSHEEYLQIPHRHPHRLVYMFRDPRDLLVSGYHSTVRTHRKVHLPELERFRDEVRALPFDEGLLRLIRKAAPRLREIETWVGREGPEVATFRLEEVDAEPRTEVDRMLRHAGVVLTATELEAVLADVSRDALQARDLARRGDGQSHYRVRRETFRDVFGPEHHAAVAEVVPGLVERLGYPT
ncbi:MAG TPA: sulfotransferase domain-containing protein [Marmoricola sp.]|nr:sulfotransferase domain-containing protein [Marmoricola sp.]